MSSTEREVADVEKRMLRAARRHLSTFDLSRYMGASLTMIDRHYGHLAKAPREHAIALLDALTRDDVHAMDATRTRKKDSLSAAAL